MSNDFSMSTDGSGTDNLPINFSALIVSFAVDQEVITSMDDAIHTIFEFGHLGAYRQTLEFLNLFGLVENEIDLIGDTWIIFIETSYKVIL